jgi:acyl dehydratase
VGRSIHLRFAKLPSGLACYPRVVLTKRQPITEVSDPPEVHARVERVVIGAADVAKYSEVCGFRAGEGVPVTFPHLLATPLQLKIFSTEAFPLRPMGLIHLSNVIEMPGALRPGLAVDVDVAARNYHKTDAGIVFDLESQLASEGRVLWRETCVFLSRWPDSVERTGGRPPRPPKAPKDAIVLRELTVSLKTAWDYAKVSRDFNPIHLNARAARFLGLRGAIAHGMWSLARSLAEAPYLTPAPDARLETQFLTPVQLPATVNVKQWVEGGEARRAMCDVRTGRVHMYAQWTSAAAAKVTSA